MANNITLTKITRDSGAYVAGTTFETEQQVGGEHRPVVSVGSNGFNSVLNQTATPLAANAVWTGTGEDVTEYTVIMVSVYADVAGAVDGLEFQFSRDGVNYRTTDAYKYTNTTCKTYAFQTVGKYFRVKYTNGAAPQTTFELCTQYKKSGGVFRSHRLSDNLNGQDDVDPVKAVIAAERPGGSDEYINVQATTAGNIKVSVEESEPVFWHDYGSEVAIGKIPGVTPINKFGAAPDGIQTTETDVWSRADATPTQQIWLAPTAARVHALASTNAGDNGAVIRVYGLATWATAESYQDITLPANTTSLVIIHRMKLLQTAAHPVLLGTVTAAAAVNNTVTAVILPADNQTEMAIYGVPSGYTFILKRWRASIGKGATTIAVNFKLMVNERPDLQTTGFIRKDDINLVSTGTSANIVPYDGNPFSGPCIIKVTATSSAADTDATSGFYGYLVTN